MIIGIGNDLIDIRRIEKTLARHGDRFINRIFTDIERAKSDRRAARAASYAKRFAAKEACAKALGTGLSRGATRPGGTTKSRRLWRCCRLRRDRLDWARWPVWRIRHAWLLASSRVLGCGRFSWLNLCEIIQLNRPQSSGGL